MRINETKYIWVFKRGPVKLTLTSHSGYDMIWYAGCLHSSVVTAGLQCWELRACLPVNWNRILSIQTSQAITSTVQIACFQWFTNSIDWIFTHSIALGAVFTTRFLWSNGVVFWCHLSITLIAFRFAVIQLHRQVYAIAADGLNESFER